MAKGIIPQRTRYDCAVAALATALGWTYEHARDVLGGQVELNEGASLLPIMPRLLAAGVAGTYLLPRDRARVPPEMAGNQAIRLLPSAEEVHGLLKGRRAIVAVRIPGELPGRPIGSLQGHALAWDGERAIECGGTGEVARPPRELSFDDYPLQEALILTDAPAERRLPAEVRPATEIDGADAEALAAIFDRHERAVLAFSGGKESIALAHMLLPWRERVTLIWVDTGMMAPHMRDFVRGYRDQGWTLEEIPSPNLLEHWQAVGIPAEVFPQANVTGQALPRLQPWAACCRSLRQEPMNAYLREQSGSVAYINGQRRDDLGGATVVGLASQLPASVEVIQPLADWAEPDVFAYIERHGLTLPPQYAQGYADSIECIACPAPMKAERMRYLVQHYPDVVPFVHQHIAPAVQASQQAMNQIGAALLPCFEDRT